MRYFKKLWFWGLFFIVVFTGSLFFLNFDLQNDLQNQYTGIPNLSAGDFNDSRAYRFFNSNGFVNSYGNNLFGPDLGIRPSDILFTYDNSTYQGTQRGVSPHDVLFDSPNLFMPHPGSIAFQNTFPGDVIIKGSNGKTKMRTIMTCNGCIQTMATCDWYCGPTFSYCNTGIGYGSSFTGLICPGPTGLICDSGGNSLMTCSSGGIFCGVGGGATANTCYVFGCSAFSVYPGGGNSFMTCGSSLYGVCGGQMGGIYGWPIPYEPGSPPPF